MATQLQREREVAIHLLRIGYPVKAVAEQLDRSERWVRKWRNRFEQEGWRCTAGRSRAPKRHGTRIADDIRQAIALARSQLEAEASAGKDLKYIGGRAVRTKLREWQVKPLPSVPTIERVLREFDMTGQHKTEPKPEIDYPHLRPTAAHQLCQVDIVPHYLTGGERVACFNAIDVVSRYPTGKAYAQRRSQDAAEFLIHVWQTLGIPYYTQLDNEGCFSGGFTHQHVLGKVVRLALTVGTELVFSPVRHPQSNSYVERFHQDYDRHVWDATYLSDYQAVERQSDHFFELYRHSRHHSALQENSPHELHHQSSHRLLDADFCLPSQKLPLREGRIHFIRRVSADGTVSVLNADWAVPNPDPEKGVWVTIELRTSGALLSIYDAAPDVSDRCCLATYPFPLKEEVLPAHRVSQAEQQADHPDETATKLTHQPLLFLPSPAVCPQSNLLDPHLLIMALGPNRNWLVHTLAERSIDGFRLLRCNSDGTIY
jgi:transposase InsO family protein